MKRSDTAETPRLPATTGVSLARRVSELMESQDLTIYGLAKRTGLAESGLGDLLHGHVSKPRASTIRRLATGLGVDVDDLLEKDPHHRTIEIVLADDLLDIALAMAAVQQSSAEAVLSREVGRLLRDHARSDIVLGAVVSAIRAARTHPDTVEAAQEA